MPVEGQFIDGLIIQEDETNICPFCEEDSVRVEYATMTQVTLEGYPPCIPITNYLYYQCYSCGRAFHMDSSYFSVIQDRLKLGSTMKAIRDSYQEAMTPRDKYHLFSKLAKLTHWDEMMRCMEYLLGCMDVVVDDYLVFHRVYENLRYEGHYQFGVTGFNAPIHLNPRYKPESFANAAPVAMNRWRLQSEINAMVEGMENIEPGRFIHVDSVPPELRDPNPSYLPGHQEAPHVWVGDQTGTRYVVDMVDSARIGPGGLRVQEEWYQANLPRLHQYAEGAVDLDYRIAQADLIQRYQQETGHISLHPIQGQPVLGGFLDEVTTAIETTSEDSQQLGYTMGGVPLTNYPSLNAAMQRAIADTLGPFRDPNDNTSAYNP
jgi:hypothetical protein